MASWLENEQRRYPGNGAWTLIFPTRFELSAASLPPSVFLSLAFSAGPGSPNLNWLGVGEMRE
jgi:hypothetical protein